VQRNGGDSSNGSGHFLGPHFHDNQHHMWHLFHNVDLNKFVGFGPTRWVTQIEHYFSLQGIIDDLMKLKVVVLYLEREHW
jgi:hypothetical protein